MTNTCALTCRPRVELNVILSCAVRGCGDARAAVRTPRSSPRPTTCRRLTREAAFRTCLPCCPWPRRSSSFRPAPTRVKSAGTGGTTGTSRARSRRMRWPCARALRRVSPVRSRCVTRPTRADVGRGERGVTGRRSSGTPGRADAPAVERRSTPGRREVGLRIAGQRGDRHRRPRRSRRCRSCRRSPPCRRKPPAVGRPCGCVTPRRGVPGPVDAAGEQPRLRRPSAGMT